MRNGNVANERGHRRVERDRQRQEVRKVLFRVDILDRVDILIRVDLVGCVNLLVGHVNLLAGLNLLDESHYTIEEVRLANARGRRHDADVARPGYARARRCWLRDELERFCQRLLLVDVHVAVGKAVRRKSCIAGGDAASHLVLHRERRRDGRYLGHVLEYDGKIARIRQQPCNQTTPATSHQSAQLAYLVH